MPSLLLNLFQLCSLDEARARGDWSSLNIAFIDPEGLEIEWKTIEKLASVSRMDMIINFSTGGLNRTQHLASEAIDRYFGNQEWRKIVTSTEQTSRRRQFINLYRNQLKQFDYHISDIDGDSEYHDIAMRNSKNAEVYSLIFASKHPLGDKFWQDVKKQVDKLRHRSNRLL